MEEAIKRLEKRIADELDDQAWDDLQELYKYIHELEAARKINLEDRVKVINVGSAPDSTKDLIGTVKRITIGEEPPILVYFESIEDYWFYDFDDLEKVEE